MKPTTKSSFRRALPWCALTLLSAGTASAQTLLLSDNFNTAGNNYGDFNYTVMLTADQSGTAATKDYNTNVGGAGWRIPTRQRRQLADVRQRCTRWRNKHAGSLNYDIAAAANTANSPLEIKFNMSVNNGAGATPALWTSFTVGSVQNPFVNSNTVGFSSLFRDNGGTQQFSNSALTLVAILHDSQHGPLH